MAPRSREKWITDADKLFKMKTPADAGLYGVDGFMISDKKDLYRLSAYTDPHLEGSITGYVTSQIGFYTHRHSNFKKISSKSVVIGGKQGIRLEFTYDKQSNDTVPSPTSAKQHIVNYYIVRNQIRYTFLITGSSSANIKQAEKIVYSTKWLSNKAKVISQNCDACEGTAQVTRPCHGCGGGGWQYWANAPGGQTTWPCVTCHGGRLLQFPCPDCSGSGSLYVIQYH